MVDSTGCIGRLVDVLGRNVAVGAQPRVLTGGLAGTSWEVTDSRSSGSATLA